MENVVTEEFISRTEALKARRTVNPIIDWEEEDVLSYCAEQKVTMNPLYACGWKRVGCIGCPLAKKATRYAEFARYPKIKTAYVRAFDRMLDERRRRGKMAGGMRFGETGEDVMRWWLEDCVLPGQIAIEGMEDET